ncbi:multidrug efflux SMR transporter [Geitlerinema sp. PCC 9228]|jgi:small multidrug resistance pump|uniref:DMT family transporter n=1 Tax=Geitlerinema sp. PCC 9228 TaxID=111611 RepID=UPI0008F9C129|nr:multidrug efflux SMR transporter [Geitlerinema sp. PCC 9228]
MHWLYLILAIALEVCGTTAMKFSQGFTKALPSLLLFVFYGLAFTLLTLALKKIELSVAYAMWSGLGTALIAIVGIYWFQESMTLVKFLSLVAIVAGVVGLNATSSP